MVVPKEPSWVENLERLKVAPKEFLSADRMEHR
jgi:hypothetical protein